MSGVRRALADIARLRDEQGRRATSIDWERLLTVNYRALVPRDGVIVDVGAHHGMHARRFVRYLAPRHLVLVEPIPELAAGLRREFRRREQVEVRQVALSDRSGTSTFVVNETSPGLSGLRLRRDHDSERMATRSIDVTVERLDDWALPAPLGYMKIDVEGGELDVLRGGRELMRRDRPIVSIEFGGASETYGHSPDTLAEWCVGLRYALFDLLGNRIELGRVGEVVNVYYWDFLLVPDERVEALTPALERARAGAFHSIEHFHPTVERWRKRLRR